MDQEIDRLLTIAVKQKQAREKLEAAMTPTEYQAYVKEWAWRLAADIFKEDEDFYGTKNTLDIA